jgi:hypothetical protein
MEAFGQAWAAVHGPARGTFLSTILTDSTAVGGNPSRYLQFAEKLSRGEAVTILSFGGSVTCGNGINEPIWAYPGLVERWLNDNLPTTGSKNHSVVNLCTSAMGSCGLMQKITYVHSHVIP